MKTRFNKKIASYTTEEVVSNLTNPIKKEEEDSIQSFSSSLGGLANPKDIVLPYINDWRTVGRNVVMLGEDNLFPQLLDTLYHASVLNGAILSFKEFCISGGGYTIEGIDTMPIKDKLKLFEFVYRVFSDDFLEIATYDLVTHERMQAEVFIEGGIVKSVDYIKAGKARKTTDGFLAYCDDWKRKIEIEYLPKYDARKKEGTFYIEKSSLKSDDYYAIPSYTSANNWAALEYESSVLHKSNIYEGIFPSYILNFPKKPNPREMETIKRNVDSLRGTRNTSKVMTFFGNNKEQLPELLAAPQAQTDKIFLQTDERIDVKICQAHGIDPLIMGHRVSGKLGSGTDIEKATAIFDFVRIAPYQRRLEGFCNEILRIGGFIGLNFKLNKVDLIDALNRLQEKTKEKGV